MPEIVTSMGAMVGVRFGAPRGDTACRALCVGGPSPQISESGSGRLLGGYNFWLAGTGKEPADGALSGP